MKRLVTSLVVFGLMAAFLAADSQAQGYYHRGRRHSSYVGGGIHRSPYGYPSWNYSGPRYQCPSYGYPNYYCPRPNYWGGYPYYGGYPCYGYGGIYGAYGWGSGGLAFGLRF